LKVTWSPLAIDRAEEESAFIAADKPDAGRRWLEAVFKAVDRLEQFPLSGHPLPEVDSARYRQVLFKAHRIIYRIDTDTVVILTVRRSKRLLDLNEVVTHPD
jgi:plasmid stabilization system protein ParE